MMRVHLVLLVVGGLFQTKCGMLTDKPVSAYPKYVTCAKCRPRRKGNGKFKDTER